MRAVVSWKTGNFAPTVATHHHGRGVRDSPKGFGSTHSILQRGINGKCLVEQSGFFVQLSSFRIVLLSMVRPILSLPGSDLFPMGFPVSFLGLRNFGPVLFPISFVTGGHFLVVFGPVPGFLCGVPSPSVVKALYQSF